MKTLVIEHTAPFQGLPELVADAEGLFAVCIQHEIDHLNGVLFVDHLSRLKRDRAISRVRKAATEKAPAL